MNNYKIPDLKTAVSVLKLKAATVAFLISDGGSGLWSTFTAAIPDMKTFVQNGGILTISVGGASGPYIQDTMTTTEIVSCLAGVLQETGCRRLDFDIEGASLTNIANIDILNKAITQLQIQFTNLFISYTIPVGQPQWGSITSDGLALINNIIKNGVINYTINGMLMDVYAGTSTNWSTMSINIVENMKTQLQVLLPNKTSKQIYGMIGGTFMSGLQDDGSTFKVSDAIVFANYAKTNGLASIGFWALQRDQIGSGSLAIYNGINTSDYQFYNAINSIITTGGSSVITTGGSSVITTGGNSIITTGGSSIITTGGNSIQSWNVGVKYTIGTYVTYNNHTYECIYNNTSILSWAPGIYTQALWKLIN